MHTYVPHQNCKFSPSFGTNKFHCRVQNISQPGLRSQMVMVNFTLQSLNPRGNKILLSIGYDFDEPQSEPERDSKKDSQLLPAIE